MANVKQHLRNTFLAGVFAAIPLAVTGFVVWYAETTTRAMVHIDIPFVGVAIAIAAIYLLGLIVTSLLGRWLLRAVDRLLHKVPGLCELYGDWKQVLLTPGASQGIYSKVVLVEEQPGHWTIAFTSGEAMEGQLACVFVPAAPNPTSGRLYLVPLSRCKAVDVTPEEAFKMILAGGELRAVRSGRVLRPAHQASGPLSCSSSRSICCSLRTCSIQSAGSWT